MRLWSMENEPHAIGGQTKFTLMKLVDGSNSIPVIFEGVDMVKFTRVLNLK